MSRELFSVSKIGANRSIARTDLQFQQRQALQHGCIALAVPGLAKDRLRQSMHVTRTHRFRQHRHGSLERRRHRPDGFRCERRVRKVFQKSFICGAGSADRRVASLEAHHGQPPSDAVGSACRERGLPDFSQRDWRTVRLELQFVFLAVCRGRGTGDAGNRCLRETPFDVGNIPHRRGPWSLNSYSGSCWRPGGQGREQAIWRGLPSAGMSAGRRNWRFRPRSPRPRIDF